MYNTINQISMITLITLITRNRCPKSCKSLNFKEQKLNKTNQICTEKNEAGLVLTILAGIRDTVHVPAGTVSVEDTLLSTGTRARLTGVGYFSLVVCHPRSWEKCTFRVS